MYIVSNLTKDWSGQRYVCLSEGGSDGFISVFNEQDQTSVTKSGIFQMPSIREKSKTFDAILQFRKLSKHPFKKKQKNKGTRSVQKWRDPLTKRF